MSATSERERDERKWYVRMEAGGAVYGPVRTPGLLIWTTQGRVLPDDEISEDQVHWRSAHTLPELQMDTLIAHPNGTFIGPFHKDALQVLIQEGKIPPESVPFPKEELSERMKARQMLLFGEDEPAQEKPKPTPKRKRGKKAVETTEDGGAGVVAGEEEDLRPQLAELKDLLQEAQGERDALRQKLQESEAALAEVQEALREVQARVEHCEAEAASERAEALREYAELLNFSNSRDREYQEELARLRAQVTECVQRELPIDRQGQQG